VPLFEPTRLFEIANADQRSELIRLFIDQMTAQLPLLADAIAASEPEAAYQIAHGLAGSAATVGAPCATGICRAICEVTRHAGTQNASQLHSQLVAAATSTGAAMLAYLERGGANTTGGAVTQPHTPTVVPVRVATADDDPVARVAIEAMINRADGLAFVGGAAGVEGIVELAVLKRPDVIVLDWMMPGGGGSEAARRIFKQSPDTRIVGLTSLDSCEASLEMARAGARGFLVKGCSADRLTSTIYRAALRTSTDGTVVEATDIEGMEPAHDTPETAR
jgi:CheY-like chemotaxis protein